MNSVCRMFNMSYSNIINNRVYNVLKNSNIQFTSNEFNNIKYNSIEYIIKKFVSRQYKCTNEQQIIINDINNKLLHSETNNKENNNIINPILVNKNNMMLSKLKIDKRKYTTYCYLDRDNRIIEHYKEKIYDNPDSIYNIKDSKLFNAIMNSSLCVQDYEYINKQHKTKDEILDYFINRQHEHIEIRKMIKNQIKNNYNKKI